MNGSDDSDLSIGDYQVAVFIAPDVASARTTTSRLEDQYSGPGFDETSGMRSSGRHAAEFALRKGDAAVKLATEAIARQIGMAAQRIAEVIDEQVVAPPAGTLSLERVEVSFGVTLTAGIEALFTVKSESSAEVTIVLSRRPAS